MFVIMTFAGLVVDGLLVLGENSGKYRSTKMMRGRLGSLIRFRD